MGKISFGNTIKSNQLGLVEMDDVFNMIKGDIALKAKIDELRQLPTEQERREYKIAHLSYFTTGQFQNGIRKKENLFAIKIMILDIDHQEQNQIEALKSQLKADPEIDFFFTSPSGQGLKVAVELDQAISEPDEYERVYRSYSVFFSAKYGVEVDTHACDCSRACFLSYDEDLYCNEAHEQINVNGWTETYESIFEQKKMPGKADNQTENIPAVIQLLIVKNNETGTIYNDYHKWQLLGLSLVSLGEAGREHFLALSLGNTHFHDTEEAVNAEYDKLLRYYGQTTKSPVGIGTIFHIAQRHGFIFSAATVPDQQVSTNPAAVPVSNKPKTLKDELKEIAILDSESERDIKLKALATTSGASVRSLKNDLKAIMAESTETVITDEKIILAHPSYDVREDFLILGFRETVIVNNAPEDRNVFLVNDVKKYHLTSEKFLKLDDARIVFDMRGREMINISDRWSRAALDSFLATPAVPINTYARIKTVLKEHIDFQKPDHYGTVAAWILATYFHRCFYAFPYLNFFGKKQTAKTRGLEILEKLALNAVKVKGTSVASFVDTVDGLRGAFLTDQAESLSDPRNVEIVGYHADSYTVGGGKRRIVQIVNGARKVLQFESYGPKAYSAQKELDEDLRDRCIIIAMIRTNKEFPYPAAHLPIWAELRNDLYRLLLTKWQEVQKIYPETGKDLSMRIRELWRPLDTVLRLENVSEQEIAGIKKVFLESMAFSQDELSEREMFLIEALLKLAEAKKDDPNGISLAASDIGNQMKAMAQTANTDLGFDKDRALFTWIGFAIKRLSLFTGRDTTKNARKHQYFFHFHHVNDIAERFKMKVTDGTKAVATVVLEEVTESNQEEILPDQIDEILKSMMDNQGFEDTEGGKID
ncbi:MAG: BT4734/BF3469 family protein [Syntrophus sp. (in: bacteria)]